MTRFKYIYENEQGVTCFDRYFSYLQTVSKEMPAILFGFANDTNRYELNGKHTLHDAWLKSFGITKDYLDSGDTRTTVNIILLLAMQKTSIRLVYDNVLDFKFSLVPKFWPEKPVDLLVHEFIKIGDGVFRHLIQFDRDVWIELTFIGFGFDESFLTDIKKT